MTKYNAIHGEFSGLLQPFHAAARSLVQAFRAVLTASAPRQTAATLNAHLLHDIGESDCRPVPGLSLKRSQAAHQRSLDAMKLRSF